MTVRKDTRKGWMIDYVHIHADGSRERVRKTSPVQTRRGAEAYERQVRQEMMNEQPGAKPGRREVDTPRFEEFVEEFMAFARTNNKPSEVSSKESILRVHLKPALGSRRLDQIGVREVERLKARLTGQGLKPKTVNNVLAVLGKLLSHAVELEVLEKKPRIRLLRVSPQRFDFLTFEEYDRLIEVLPSEPLWGSAILAAGDAGLRVGEVRGLFWEDIDLVAGVITVRRSMWRDRMGSPKGGRERKVPMTGRLAAALRGVRHLRGDHVWCQDDGKPLTINQAEFVIQRVYRRAGLRKIGWHVLRHGFCSHLAMAGAAPKAIQELAGHRSITTTMRYMHLAPSALHEAIGLLDKRLEGGAKLHGRGTYVAPRKG